MESPEEINAAEVEDVSSKQSEQEISRTSVGTSIAYSLKSTVQSATGLLPEFLGGSVDHGEEGGEGSKASNEGKHGAVEKEASLLTVGDDPSRADEKVVEDLSPKGTTTDSTADEWSVVDHFPEEEEDVEKEEKEEAVGDHGHWRLQSKSVQGEEESGDISAMAENEAAFQPEADPCEGDRHLSGQATHWTLQSKSVQGEEESGDISAMAESEAAFRPQVDPCQEDRHLSGQATHWTFQLKCVQGEEESGDISAMAESEAAFRSQVDPREGDRHLSGQARSFESPIVTAEPEIQEEDGHSIAPPSGYVAGSPPYVSSSSLRRRPRSFAMSDAHSSQFSEIVDISAIADDQSAFHPPSAPPLEAAVDTEFESFAGFHSKEDNPNELTWRKEPESRSGYDPELEDDDNDASSASSVASREANHVVDPWKRSAPSMPEKGWEESGSSSGLEGRALIPETRQRREVYRMPGSDAEGEDNGGESPRLLAQPAGFVVRAVEFQLNLIVHVIAICIWLVNFTLSTLSHPISRTVAVTDRVTNLTGGATQLLEVFSFFGDGVSQAGPIMGKLSKKTFWGCLSVVYVICMLGLLLIPALFMDIVIVNSVVDEPVTIRQDLDFDFTQPRPVALLPLFPSSEIERIKSLPLDKAVKTRAFAAGNKFHVSVALTLPESNYNMKLGMFQVTAETLSARGKVISRSSKPCRLRYKSLGLQLVNTLLYAVPHLLGLSNDAQTLEIRLLEAQEKVIPTASVRILIEPKASGGGGVPEIYGAAIVLESTLPWPKAILSSCKWLFFIWNGVCLFLLEVGVIFCCCRRVLIPTFGRESVAEEEIVEGEVKDEMATRAMIKSSRRPRNNRRVYFEDDVPGAAGTQDRRGTRMLKHQDEEGNSEAGVDDKDTSA